jgi:hypothetical protein
MNCKYTKFYCIVVLLFFFKSFSYAQGNNESDSGSSGGAVIALDSTDDDVDNMVDTIITRTIFDSSNDSILKWKHSAAFGYMVYLDSLLKKKKNNLRIDTISIDKNSGSRSGQTFSITPGTSGGFLNSFPVKIFFWLLAIFFIGFILYKLFFKGDLFTRGNVKHESESISEEPEKLSEYSAYNELIHEAELKNDFNLATRYLYLQSLKKLADRELILFSPDKTNNVYVDELSGRSFQSEFVYLTSNYEYAWYGKFAISPIRYDQLKAQFILFNKKF